MFHVKRWHAACLTLFHVKHRFWNGAFLIVSRETLKNNEIRIAFIRFSCYTFINQI